MIPVVIRTEDEDIDIHGKSQQVEGHNDDSNLLEEDNRTEVNFVEEQMIFQALKRRERKLTLFSLPLYEPLDASSPNKVPDDVLGKGKQINAIPSQGVDNLQGTIFISNLPFDVDYGACYRRPRAGHGKELQKTKKEDNHHHNLCLAKGLILEGSGQEVTNVQDKDSGGPVGILSLPTVKSTTSGSSKEQSADDEVVGEAEMTQGTDPADVKCVRRLVSGRNDFMIRVRLCRMWDVINHRKNGKLISMEMIFIDDKGNLAHAIVRKNHVSKFKHKLIEGSFFIIKNFKVVESSGVYRPVENSLKIIFLSLNRDQEFI
ncbi:hypothetical protein P3S68_015005 [Capsicum galapagoense]